LTFEALQLNMTSQCGVIHFLEKCIESNVFNVIVSFRPMQQYIMNCVGIVTGYNNYTDIRLSG